MLRLGFFQHNLCAADKTVQHDKKKWVRETFCGPLKYFWPLALPPVCLRIYTQLHPKDVLGWWATKGKNQFPALAPVAQQVFGNQASAAQIERDFSGCGNLLPPNRSRMDTYWVEMVMFLKANFDHIPAYGAIPMVAPKDIRSCLPARFTGQDEDLVAAEGTFDLLNNTAAPTADGMSLE